MSAVVPVSITPLRLDLIESYLQSLSPKMQPLYAGNTWDLRLQVRDSFDAAVSLTAATVKMTVKARPDDPDSAALITRKTGILLTGGPHQIDLDADQSVEDVTNYTGKGWFTVRFRPADQAALLLALGLRCFDIRIQFGSGAVDTFAEGRIEILRPKTITF